VKFRIVLAVGAVLMGLPVAIGLLGLFGAHLETSGGAFVGKPISINGPDFIVDAIENCKFGPGWFGPGSNGLHVDWGDGAQVFSGLKRGASCADRQRTHIYTVPGEYTLRVVKWHPGPTDAPVTDWKDEVKVTVTGAATNDLLKMKDIEDTEFRYQALVPVKWTASASEDSSIRLEALLDDGTVIASSREIPWSMVGDGEAGLSLNTREYDRALYAGESIFFVRTSLIRNGRAIATDVSGPLKMTARHHENMEKNLLKWARNEGSRIVSIGIHTYEPECLSYRIDWGDDQSSEEITPIRESCRNDSQTIEVKHAYVETGTYKIKIWTNGYRPFEPLENNVAFTETEVFADESLNLPQPEAVRAAPPACRMSRPNDDAELILFSTGEAAATSTVYIGNPDVVTTVAHVRMKPGDKPVHLVLLSSGSFLWKLSGELGRIEKVVVIEPAGGRNSGVQGVPRDKVEFVGGGGLNCMNNFYGPNTADAESASAAVAAMAGRAPDEVSGIPRLYSVSLPGADFEVLKRKPWAPAGFDGEAWEAAIRFSPAGLIDTDLSSVVAQVEAGRYEVLPQGFGVAQLLASGHLERMDGRDNYRIAKEFSRFPAGLAGAHDVNFVLGRGVGMPAGGSGRNCILEEVTGERKGGACWF